MTDGWIKETQQLLEMEKELNKAMTVHHDTMVERIKTVCEKHGLKTSDISSCDDLSIFFVRFDGDTSNALHFSKTFQAELGMSFSVKRMIDKEANTILYLEIYPFKDGEE